MFLNSVYETSHAFAERERPNVPKCIAELLEIDSYQIISDENVVREMLFITDSDLAFKYIFITQDHGSFGAFNLSMNSRLFPLN